MSHLTKKCLKTGHQDCAYCLFSEGRLKLGENSPYNPLHNLRYLHHLHYDDDGLKVSKMRKKFDRKSQRLTKKSVGEKVHSDPDYVSGSDSDEEDSLISAGRDLFARHMSVSQKVSKTIENTAAKLDQCPITLKHNSSFSPVQSSWRGNYYIKRQVNKFSEPPTPTTSKPIVTTLPHAQVPPPLFTGRENFLKKLHRLLIKREKVTSSHPSKRMVVLIGLGGIGKTSTAKKYAKKYQKHHQNIAWLSVDTAESSRQSFVTLARHFDICDDLWRGLQDRGTGNETNLSGLSDFKLLVQAVYGHFSAHVKKGLFILDNANQVQTTAETFGILDCLPDESLPNLPLFLVTSRRTMWGILGDQIPTIELEKLDQEETMTFLLRALGLDDDDLVGQDAGDVKFLLKNSLSKLGNRLDGYPLALQLAAAAVSAKLFWCKIPRDYLEIILEELENYIKDFDLDLNGNKWLGFEADQVLDRYDKIMATVWWTTVSQIKNRGDELSRLAIDLLQLVAFLPTDDISVGLCSFIYHNRPFHDKDDDDLDPAKCKEVRQAFGIMEMFSMLSVVQRSSEFSKSSSYFSMTIQVHRLVQKWTRVNLLQASNFAWLVRLAQYILDNYEDFKSCAEMANVTLQFLEEWCWPQDTYRHALYIAHHVLSDAECCTVYQKVDNYFVQNPQHQMTDLQHYCLCQMALLYFNYDGAYLGLFSQQFLNKDVQMEDQNDPIMNLISQKKPLTLIWVVDHAVTYIENWTIQFYAMKIVWHIITSPLTSGEELSRFMENMICKLSHWFQILYDAATAPLAVEVGGGDHKVNSNFIFVLVMAFKIAFTVTIFPAEKLAQMVIKILDLLSTKSCKDNYESNSISYLAETFSSTNQTMPNVEAVDQNFAHAFRSAFIHEEGGFELFISTVQKSTLAIQEDSEWPSDQQNICLLTTLMRFVQSLACCVDGQRNVKRLLVSESFMKALNTVISTIMDPADSLLENHMVSEFLCAWFALFMHAGTKLVYPPRDFLWPGIERFSTDSPFPLCWAVEDDEDPEAKRCHDTILTKFVSLHDDTSASHSYTVAQELLRVLRRDGNPNTSFEHDAESSSSGSIQDNERILEQQKVSSSSESETADDHDSESLDWVSAGGEENEDETATPAPGQEQLEDSIVESSSSFYSVDTTESSLTNDLASRIQIKKGEHISTPIEPKQSDLQEMTPALISSVEEQVQEELVGKISNQDLKNQIDVKAFSSTSSDQEQIQEIKVEFSPVPVQEEQVQQSDNEIDFSSTTRLDDNSNQLAYVDCHNVNDKGVKAEPDHQFDDDHQPQSPHTIALAKYIEVMTASTKSTGAKVSRPDDFLGTYILERLSVLAEKEACRVLRDLLDVQRQQSSQTQTQEGASMIERLKSAIVTEKRNFEKENQMKRSAAEMKLTQIVAASLENYQRNMEEKMESFVPYDEFKAIQQTIEKKHLTQFQEIVPKTSILYTTGSQDLIRKMSLASQSLMKTLSITNQNFLLTGKQLVHDSATNYKDQMQKYKGLDEEALKGLHLQNKLFAINTIQNSLDLGGDKLKPQLVKDLETKISQIYKELQTTLQSRKSRVQDSIQKSVDLATKFYATEINRIFNEARHYFEESELLSLHEKVKSKAIEEFENFLQNQPNFHETNYAIPHTDEGDLTLIGIEQHFEGIKTQIRSRKDFLMASAQNKLSESNTLYSKKMKGYIDTSFTEIELRQHHNETMVECLTFFEENFLQISSTKPASIFDNFVAQLQTQMEDSFEESLELFQLRQEMGQVAVQQGLQDAQNYYTSEMDKHFNSANFMQPAALTDLSDQIMQTVVDNCQRDLQLNPMQARQIREEMRAVCLIYEEKNLLRRPCTSPAIGIDLGTTNSRVAVYLRGKVIVIPNENGHPATPSYVTYQKNSTSSPSPISVVVGEVAKSQLYRDPQNTIFDAKRLIGRKFSDPIVQDDIKHWPFQVIDDGNDRPKIRVQFPNQTTDYFPEEVSGQVLKKMKEIAEDYLGQPVTNAVITVPALFNDGQRQATKDAGEIAGLKVLKIINEPTAAAIAYQLHRTMNPSRNVLIFDLGRGTFDVAILKMADGNITVLAVGGNTHLGGEDFDGKMVKFCIDHFKQQHAIDLARGRGSKNYEFFETASRLRRLRRVCEKHKKYLSDWKNTCVDLDNIYEDLNLSVPFTRDQFETLNEVSFQECLQIVEKALEDASLTKEKIDNIVLVGGSTRIPKVREMLSQFFNGKALSRQINADEAVAHGAAIQACILNAKEQQQGDVVQFSGISRLRLMGAKLAGSRCLPT